MLLVAGEPADTLAVSTVVTWADRLQHSLLATFGLIDLKPTLVLYQLPTGLKGELRLFMGQAVFGHVLYSYFKMKSGSQESF